MSSNSTSSREDHIAYAKAVAAELFGAKRLLVSYARGPNRVIGTVVAVKHDDDTILYGWSLCNPRDRYNRHIGILKAIRKADIGPVEWPEVAVTRLASTLHQFKERAEAYFKVLPASSR